MPCDHKRTVRIPGEIDELTGEESPDTFEKHSTFVDIDIARMKCSVCGAIEYYTGQWKAYFEDRLGKPCLGSDRISESK